MKTPKRKRPKPSKSEKITFDRGVQSSLEILISEAFGDRQVGEMELRICTEEPRAYQAVVRFRDAHKAWGSGVHEDPLQALTIACRDAIENSEPNPDILWHHKRDHARAAESTILKDHADVVAATKVEFVPYRGWVVVAFVDPSHKGAPEFYESHKHLVEFREFHKTTVSRGDARPAIDEEPKSSGRKRKGRKKPASSPASGMDKPLTEMTKKELMAEHKRRHGKQPNSRIGIEDLRTMLINEGV